MFVTYQDIGFAYPTSDKRNLIMAIATGLDLTLVYPDTCLSPTTATPMLASWF